MFEQKLLCMFFLDTLYNFFNLLRCFYLFQKISKMDVNDCAKRYVCEISATPKHLRTTQDISTLSMFGQNQVKSKTTSAKYEYDVAWVRGNTARNLQKCKTFYTKCPVNGIAKFVSGMRHIQALKAMPSIFLLIRYLLFYVICIHFLVSVIIYLLSLLIQQCCFSS